MSGKIFSALLIAIIGGLGSLVGYEKLQDQWGLLGGAVIGIALALVTMYVVAQWLKADIEKIVGGAVGLVLGAVLGLMTGWPVSHMVQVPDISSTLYGMLVIVFALVGLQLGSTRLSELGKKLDKDSGEGRRIIGILDTSVIIDGRISDVCETGFLSGELIIPEFVLKELQAIADSSEALKRTRGRRGLDILHKIQKQAYVSVVISDTDYPAVKEVDLKLLNLAREKGCPILTNDFNLNKVAEVHSIQVLNMNQLANALKPVVLPGETIKVQVIKEGKEHGQGVAYLDDGTMVVIDAGRHHMGRTVDVTVTSVLQTTAGRMIFGTVKN